MTAKFNGYYNADVIMDETYEAINLAYEDNYNRILPMYPYSAVESPENMRLELDRAIEKVTKVSRLHESSKWVDDCYVLMGKAQYLQGNYEAAEETFEYFINNFNPKDPDSRIYSEKAPSAKSKSKQRQKEAQKARKEKLNERKAAEKAREKEIKENKKERKKSNKEREQAQKDRVKKASKKSVSQARKEKIKEREEAVEDSKKKEKEKTLSTKELRQKKIKEREQQIKDRRKEAKKKQNSKRKTREERDAEKLAEESKVIGTKELEEEEKSESIEKEKIEEVPTKKKNKKERKREKEESEKNSEKENEKPEKKGKNDDLRDPAKGGFLKHEPAYYEGMLWLAKTYISRENYVQAKYYINRIEEEMDQGVPAKVLNEVPVVRADLYIQQRKYNEAVEPLRQSISTTRDKGLKARYAFILAQIHQKNGKPVEAAEAFAQVEKYSKKYDMSLNAQLNQVKNTWAGGNSNYESAIKKLGRMEKDKKNADHVGAIYFTRAELKQANGDEAGAIEDFENALSTSISSINKIESYYRLATLYYGLEDYVESKFYYDSTATIMPKRDDRYVEVTRLRDNLKEIAKNIFIIETQDSLLTLAEMSKEELQAYADNILTEREQKEAAAQLQVGSVSPPPASTTGGTSKFFAYNSRSVQKGKQDFSRRWGSRQLEDDWRRSNKQSSIIIEEEVNSLDELDYDRQKEIDKILRDIPSNTKEKAKSLETLEKAYFDLGIGFRNYLKNSAKSAETLKTYVTKFPEGKNIIDAYYYLYLDYKDMNDNAETQKYYNILTRQYPKSDYAKVLKDPSYAKELMTEDRKVAKAYDRAFELFDNADFQGAFDLVKKAKTDHGNDHDMIAKYDLLEAMCIGNLKGKQEYISALRKVIIKHNNTPEQTRAREMLRFLKGDSEAFEGEISSEDLEDFVVADDKLHYIIVSLFEADGNVVNEAKNSINKYNQEKHKDKRIRSTSIYLNQKSKSHLLLLRRFENKGVAMEYFREITKDSDIFLDAGKFAYDLYAVNQQNYREIVKQKSTRTYRLFFDTYYLNSDK